MSYTTQTIPIFIEVFGYECNRCKTFVFEESAAELVAAHPKGLPEGWNEIRVRHQGSITAKYLCNVCSTEALKP